jgi:hypothetical protein
MDSSQLEEKYITLRKKVILAEKPIVPLEYIEYDDFVAMFPKGKLLGEGSYGKVYESGDYAFKVIDSEVHNVISTSAVNELNCYVFHQHPCMLRLTAWTHKNSLTMFAMPKGIPIIQAYNDGLITAEQIVYDTLGFLAYIHDKGEMHGDIKPGNLIYHDGRVKALDFGTWQQGILAHNGRTYARSNGCTLGYKDPECTHEYNVVESDLYSLAKTWYYIFTKAAHNLENIYSFSIPMYPKINELVTKMKALTDKRPTARELLEHPMFDIFRDIHRDIEGFEVTTPIPPFDYKCGKLQGVLFSWLTEVAIKFRLRARTIFLCLHLVHRSLPLVIPDYSTNRKMIQAVGIACMYLANMTYEERIIPIKDCAYTGDQICTTMIDVMNHLGCLIITPTYWDYASCAEDLAPLLEDTIKCTYNPAIIRPLKYLNTNKDILAEQIEFYTGTTSMSKKEMLVDDILKIVVRPDKSIVMSSNLDLVPQLSLIRKIYETLTRTREPGTWSINLQLHFISSVLHNRSILHTFDKEWGIKIYTTLNLFPAGKEALTQLPLDTTSGENPFLA